jgi:hypothetical protein
MMEIGLFWTLLLLAGTVALAVWLVKLLFPASDGFRNDSRRSADPLGFVNRSYRADRRDQDDSSEPDRNPNA